MNRAIQLRTNTLYVVLMLIGAVLASRLFVLQVIKHNYYSELALASQQKKYVIPAERGRIYISDGQDGRVPLVLNQKLKTLYADPRYVENPAETAQKLAEITGGDWKEYLKLLSLEDRVYVVLAKRLDDSKAKQIESLELSGIGLQDATYRVYPENSLASQIVGFVNDENKGQYGIEGYLDDLIGGKDGLLKAVTDVRGIPLATSDENVIQEPQNGSDVVLTIDRTVQSIVEEALKRGVERAEGKSGSAIVMDPNSGAILAMANYPTYDPSKFYEVDPDQQQVFNNSVVSRAYEAGSVIKPFTMATGLEEGVATPETTYYDRGFVEVDGIRIENAGASGGVTRTMTEVIQKSVNTGAIHVLELLSGGEKVDEIGREKLYSYFTERYGFGELTNIEQTSEAPGLLYKPSDPEGNNVRYANMTFGQGMTVTMLQVSAAYSALVNGGTYYQPYLIKAVVDPITKEENLTTPKALRTGIIKESTSREIKKMMEQVVLYGGGYSARRNGYIIGGKTGTSQVLDENGNYSPWLEVGSFLGFGAGVTPSYVIMTRVDEPKIPGYAGTVAAAPIFAEISNKLIDYYQIPPVVNQE